MSFEARRGNAGRERGFRAGSIVVLVCCLALVPAAAAADARSDYLIRLLEGSTQFRVRAQAAISLASVEAAPEVVRALGSALSDEHPAVRAAAANSLGRLEQPGAIAVLRSVAQDPEEPVRQAVKAAIAKLEGAARRSGVQPVVAKPSGPPRYYVAVGKPASRVADLPPGELDRARQVLVERVGQMDGVVVAAANESPTAARGVIRSRSLKGFYIDSSVTNVELKPGGGTRASVSVIVATYPDRAMRAIMQGSATAMGGGDTRAQAVAAAFRSALSQLSQAMARE